MRKYSHNKLPKIFSGKNPSHPQTFAFSYTYVHGCRKDFFPGGGLKDFFQGGSTVVKLHFTNSKLRQKTFSCSNFNREVQNFKF